MVTHSEADTSFVTAVDMIKVCSSSIVIFHRATVSDKLLDNTISKISAVVLVEHKVTYHTVGDDP